MKKTKRYKRREKEMKDFFKDVVDAASKTGDGIVKYVATEMLTADALLDDRVGGGAALYLAKAFIGMSSADEIDRLQCYCCKKDWTIQRGPTGLLVIEWLARQDEEGLVAGICGDCFGNHKLLAAVLKADFSSYELKTISEPGTALN